MHEPYLNARQAAAYIGYEPNGGPVEQDHAMKAFYAFVKRRRVKTKRLGRSLRFKRADLDAAVDQSTDEQASKLDRMEALAHAHAHATD